jgi:hypothetical protein
MPKVEIDYSNTIFYKIYCVNPDITDMYIGHTTNFVQRKHGHKQSCTNNKCKNYNCKLYTFIRDHGGWNNWIMEIIAFRNCEDHYSARKCEQEYFKESNATLNSIDPLPPLKIKKEKIKKEQLYCNTCNIYFMTTTLQETHNKTNKHIKRVNYEMPNKTPKNAKKFHCEKCNYTCSKNSEFMKHIHTAKHLRVLSGRGNKPTILTVFECKCGKKYNFQSGLCRHEKNCTFQLENSSEVAPTSEVASTQEVDKRDEVIDKLVNSTIKMEEMMMMMIKSQMHSQESTKGLLQETQETLKESQRHHKEFLKETLQRQNQETVNVVNKVIELLDCISKK